MCLHLTLSQSNWILNILSPIQKDNFWVFDYFWLSEKILMKILIYNYRKIFFCPQATNFSVQVRINQNFKFFIYPNFTEIQVCLCNFYLLLLLCYKKRLSSCEIPKGPWTSKAGWHLFYTMNWICLMAHIQYKEPNPDCFELVPSIPCVEKGKKHGLKSNSDRKINSFNMRIM